MPIKYKKLGNVAIVRVDIKQPGLEEIVQKIVADNPHIVAVLGYRGIYGEYREPEVELLWGKLPETIMHTEYGVHYCLDPSKLMFSLGNQFERLRVASLVRSWEIVVDMFAGVGQFTLPIAVHAKPRLIHAVEINPTAYEYLLRNIRLNNVEDIVIPYLSDCRELSSKLKTKADRVIMGYFYGFADFLPYALRMLGESGGIIHLHQLIKRDEIEQLKQKIQSLNSSMGFTTDILTSRVVKSYSASKIHVVIDIFVVSQDR
jgi:tRNA wybutosine-synthesizing protein 2